MEYKLFKYGEAIAITEASIQSSESVLSDPEINSRFQKLASGLKRIAPKANDFLYFSAVMMHAAEASTVNPDGTPKLTSKGEKVESSWEKKGESVRWICNDSSIAPYRNSNGDIFPEEELVKAYKKWVGKPLCIDHKSSSVDFVRGVIIDTYYDRVGKRVIALCALDKVSFPELARKVATGVSTCVSMGTAVGRAVCSDCGTVARTEHDFCNHMRTKSCYGEINLDLQPIELSIVVNGADPQAKIREILASANYLNQRADEAGKELKGLSDKDKIAAGSLRSVVTNIKEGLDALIREFEGKSEEQTESTVEEDLNKAASTETVVENAENVSNEAKTTDNLESVTAASEDTDALKRKFNTLRDSIKQKLSKIEEDFNTLLNLGDGSRDNTMEKKSYFQGAGDVNEPTPGQPKYEKDPLADKTRDTEDRQMKDIANTGPVDGMFPGDQEKKNLLARAEEEKRAERRKVALEKAKSRLEKGAYYNGTEEPTPGKPQYAKEDSDSIRDKEDKQMQGQSPFPGVGKVDGLHPSPASADQKDELKRKEMLARANFRARFVKAATPEGEHDRGASAWQIFADDKLILTATVNELSNGRIDEFYATIATKPFAAKMLAKIKELGVEKAAAVYKRANDLAPAAPAAPALGGDGAAMGADPAATAIEEADKGGSGSPADQLAGVAKEAREMSETLEEIAATMKDEEPAAMPELAPATASLQKMRVELHGALLNSVKKVASELNDSLDELDLLSGLYSEEGGVTEDNRSYVESMVADATAETKAALAEGNELLGSFVNYARGTEAVLKQAAKESEMVKVADGDVDAKIDALIEEAKSLEEEAPATEPGMPEMELGPEALPMEEAPATEPELVVDEAAASDEEALVSLDTNAAVAVEMEKEDLAKLPDNAKVEVKMAEFDLSTREGRTAYRMKLAAEAKFSPMLGESNKLTNQKPDGGDLGKVETLEETHKAVLDLATAPPKVRKDAEELLGLVKAGKIAHEDVEALVAHGLDPEVVKYYKELWKEVDGGSEFASELVKEHAKAKLEEEMASYKVKVARAYDLAYQMVERGLCSRDASVLSAQVEEIMKYNDDAFDSLKRVVAKHAPLALKKEAARVPQVGLLGNDEPTSSAAEPDDLFSSLNRAFAGRRY